MATDTPVPVLAIPTVLPTPLPDVPRRVRRRRGRPAAGEVAVGGVRAAVVLLAVAAVAGYAGRVWLLAHGAVVATVVDGVDREVVGNEDAYTLRFHYAPPDDPGRTVVAAQAADPADRFARHAGDVFPGRYARWLGRPVCVSSATDVDRRTETYAAVAGFAGMAAVAALVPPAWRARRLRRLVRHGRPVPAVVVDRDPNEGRAAACRVTCAYAGDLGEPPRTLVFPARRATCDRAVVGTPVTLLVDPRLPTRATVYEWCRYEAVPGVGGRFRLQRRTPDKPEARNQKSE